MVGLWTDRQGASAAEYALLLAIFAAGVAMAVIFLSTAITAAVQTPQM
ncbi:MAG: Flp family type IVb pilin [Woeseia sp.]